MRKNQHPQPSIVGSLNNPRFFSRQPVGFSQPFASVAATKLAQMAQQRAEEKQQYAERWGGQLGGLGDPGELVRF